MCAAGKTGIVRNAFYILAYFILILTIWFAFFLVPQPKMVALEKAYDSYDLSEYDFENSVYLLDAFWEAWPGVFYTPEDFENGKVGEAPQFLTQVDSREITYATYRLRMTLPGAHQSYGVSMLTSEFSMRLYINGVETDRVGVPGETRENTEHRALEKVYFLLPENGEVELLVQAANFAHNNGCLPPSNISIGLAQNILEHQNASRMVSFLIVGSLITSFLYHLGLFCLNRQRRTTFVFALCCLLLALMNKKLLLALWPNYAYAVGIRLEYAIHFLTFGLLVRFLEMLHPRLLHSRVAQGYYGLVGIYLFTLCLDSLFFTAIIAGFEWVSLGMIFYIFARLAMQLKEGKLQNLLSFVAVLVIGVLGANDVLYYQGIVLIPPVNGQFFMAPLGMVFFVFCYSLVLSIQHEETEKNLADAHEKKMLLENENASLEHINRLKSDLMETISHEARTPLAVLASYSGLVSMELREKKVDVQMAEDLDTIAFEAKRVAELIDSMKRMTLQIENAAKRTRLNVGEMVLQIARLYKPILERNSIALKIHIAEGLPQILANSEELTRVIFNLLQNAKNHTESGWVSVDVFLKSRVIEISVSDTGAGIPQSLMPVVFDRGVTGGRSGNGIGLAVCKEIIQAHGGHIRIESEAGRGTTVTFTLPVLEGEEACEA